MEFQNQMANKERVLYMLYEEIKDKEDLKYLEKISESLNRKNMRIKYLEEENKKLKDEHFKDLKLKEMQEEIDKLHKDCVRGFPITESEQSKIDSIKKEHQKECPRCNFNYIFEPYPIVEFGSLYCCTCGKKFKFYEH